MNDLYKISLQHYSKFYYIAVSLDISRKFYKIVSIHDKTESYPITNYKGDIVEAIKLHGYVITPANFFVLFE